MSNLSVELKRFFKDRFGLPVRVRSLRGKTGYVEVRIPAKSVTPLAYEYSFPSHLGNLCLRVVYPGSVDLHKQCWAGNVRQHDICITADQWQQVIAAL